MEEKVAYIEQRVGANAEAIVIPVRIENIGSTRHFEGSALWDTGAARTTIAQCVADTLQLDTLPFGLMNTPAGSVPCNVGAVLVFPGNVKRFVPVATSVMNGARRACDVIIGMDVIRRGDMILRHEGDSLIFRFDFGKEFSTRK